MADEGGIRSWSWSRIYANQFADRNVGAGTMLEDPSSDVDGDLPSMH